MRHPRGGGHAGSRPCVWNPVSSPLLAFDAPGVLPEGVRGDGRGGGAETSAAARGRMRHPTVSPRKPPLRLESVSFPLHNPSSSLSSTGRTSRTCGRARGVSACSLAISTTSSRRPASPSIDCSTRTRSRGPSRAGSFGYCSRDRATSSANELAKERADGRPRAARGTARVLGGCSGPQRRDRRDGPPTRGDPRRARVPISGRCSSLRTSRRRPLPRWRRSSDSTRTRLRAASAWRVGTSRQR